MFTRRVHHRFAASHHQQANTGIFEQPLGGFDIRVRHGDQQIFRTTGGDHRLIEESDCPLRDLFAAGCGANTTLLPAAIRLMALLITVAAGLVDGVTEATTPHGAFSISVRPLSPVSTCGDKHSTPGVPRACATFWQFIVNASHAGFADGKFR